MANQKILDQKQLVIDEITDHVKASKASVFFEYRGLTVSEMTELRRGLKKVDSDVKVYKNTLVERALNTLDLDLKEHLNGPKAMAFGPDAVAPIKVLSDFSKKHPALEMKVGIVEGGIANINTLNELAAIPSREGLLTMLAGGLIATVRDLAICLDLHSQNLEK
ncbi:MAG: 50S ribosomal protein L10 [Bacilli bacterium]|nr:50S ribosomal protein L10 [Bacilli bacterium]